MSELMCSRKVLIMACESFLFKRFETVFMMLYRFRWVYCQLDNLRQCIYSKLDHARVQLYKPEGRHSVRGYCGAGWGPGTSGKFVYVYAYSAVEIVLSSGLYKKFDISPDVLAAPAVGSYYSSRVELTSTLHRTTTMTEEYL